LTTRGSTASLVARTGGPAGLARRRDPRQSFAVRYVGKIYRPPSEADALIVQATIGCSWNHCTYCDLSERSERLRSG